MLMLSVNVQKTGCCCFHLADSTCLSVDLVDTSAVHDLAGHQHLSVFRIDVKRRKGLSGFRVFNLKQQLYQGIGSIFTNHASGSFSTKDKLYGS